MSDFMYWFFGDYPMASLILAIVFISAIILIWKKNEKEEKKELQMFKEMSEDINKEKNKKKKKEKIKKFTQKITGDYEDI